MTTTTLDRSTNQRASVFAGTAQTSGTGNALALSSDDQKQWPKFTPNAHSKGPRWREIVETTYPIDALHPKKHQWTIADWNRAALGNYEPVPFMAESNIRWKPGNNITPIHPEPVFGSLTIGTGITSIGETSTSVWTEVGGANYEPVPFMAESNIRWKPGYNVTPIHPESVFGSLAIGTGITSIGESTTSVWTEVLGANYPFASVPTNWQSQFLYEPPSTRMGTTLARKLTQSISESFEAQGFTFDEAGVSAPWDEAIAPKYDWDFDETLEGVFDPRSLNIWKANPTKAANWPTRALTVVSNPYTEQTIEAVTNPIAESILAERTTAQIDEECRATANLAVEDALAVIRNNKLGGSPLVVFSDDGILSLQWERDRHGVGLIFAGDGLASVVFRRPDQFYAENGIEAPVESQLPREFDDALDRILK